MSDDVVRPVPRVEIAPTESRERNLPGLGRSVQHLYSFANGYAASVIQGWETFGGTEGLWELAVLHGDQVVYDTPITSDVVGYLTDDEIGMLLLQIARLPRRDLDARLGLADDADAGLSHALDARDLDRE